MDPITPTPTAPEPEPQNNQATPPPPPPPPVPSPPTAAGSWTPDMAVDPTTAGAPTAYVSNPLALVKPSWNAIKHNLGTLLFPALVFIPAVLILLALFIGGAVLAKSTPSAGTGIFIAAAIVTIATVVLAILFAPYPTIVLLAGAKGQKLTFKEAFSQSKLLAGKFFIMGVLVGLAVLGGFLLLFIPGIIFGTWFSLSAFVMVAEGLGPVDSMKRSKLLIGGHFAETLAVAAVPTAANILMIVPVIGSIVSGLFTLLYSAAPAVRYIQLSDLKSSGAPAPAVHWLNYAVIVAALISLPLRYSTIPKTKTPVPSQLPVSNEAQFDTSTQ